MGLILAGIDEAGYGPMLGPLTVALAVFRVDGWTEGDPAPDLWRLLSRCVCTAPGDARRRLAIADSKRLKRPNAGRRHPLEWIERAVLASLAAAGRTPRSDVELDRALGCPAHDAPWYAGDPLPIPLAHDPAALATICNDFRAGLDHARCAVVDLRCARISERLFNETVSRTGSKAQTTLLGIGSHLRRVLASDAAREGSGLAVRIVCDRLGGRTRYTDALRRAVPGATVDPLDESDALCRYRLSRPGRRVIVSFMPEAESAHLPVALASLVAKYVRELAMLRFNRYWCARLPELAPTAGYVADARRWLAQAGPHLEERERDDLVRIA